VADGSNLRNTIGNDIALSRFAGLRCPSEIVELRWGDLNWERSLMTVRSPKTAAHDGHAVRIVPITPELRPILQTLFDQAPEGGEAVVPPLTDPTTNLCASSTTCAPAGPPTGPRPCPPTEDERGRSILPHERLVADDADRRGAGT
jgi:hypothetical protein